MNWDFMFNEDGSPKTPSTARSKSEWRLEGRHGCRDISRQEVLQRVRDMPVPIYSYDEGYIAGKCRVRMPGGSIKDVTPKD